MIVHVTVSARPEGSWIVVGFVSTARTIVTWLPAASLRAICSPKLSNVTVRPSLCRNVRVLSALIRIDTPRNAGTAAVVKLPSACWTNWVRAPAPYTYVITVALVCCRNSS